MKTGRIPLHSFATSTFWRSSFRHTSVATIAALLQCPAFFCGCIPIGPIPIPAAIHTKGYEADALDLFFFDAEGRLDAYQQLPAPARGTPVYGVSSEAAVQLAVLSTRTGDSGAWWDLASYPQLCKYSFRLADESPDKPLLAGEVRLQPGASRHLELTLHPLLTCIRLCSVSCDFSGLPYAGTPLLSDKLYIQFAGTEMHPLGAGDRAPVSWVNDGEADSSAVMQLPHPEMVLQEGAGAIGPERVYLNRSFYFYPGPRSSLVLSGNIGEDYCYYPIPLRGIRPGGRYDLHLTLRRKGSPDAHTPVENGTVTIETLTVPWSRGDSKNLCL